jgi:hypothetical protein
MKTQRTCIFCGKLGSISKEHFWPEWLESYLPKQAENAYVSELHVAEGKVPKRLQDRMERQGSVTTKKIRVVCKNCNNGWMSRLEESAKMIMRPVLEGHSYTLAKTEIQTLACWVAVKTIVGEHAEGQMALTPAADRFLLHESHRIPEYFRIFVGTHISDTKAAYVRHSTTVSRTMDGPNPPLPPGVRRNIQTVTFLVGPLLFHTIAARVADFSIDEVFVLRSLAKLWPVPSEDVDLSLLPVIDDHGLSGIAGQLDMLIASPRVLYGGPLQPRTA